jgi:hypothetical protein
MQSSLTTPFYVNNYNGGLRFSFTITDTISNKDSVLITFPTGTNINYVTYTSTLKMQSVSYNPSTLTLQMTQNTTNPNYFAGTAINITFIRYQAGPSIRPTQPITLSIINNNYQKMTASATITAVANSYSLTTTTNNPIVSVYTSYIFTFTMSDPLSSSGIITITLDPQLCSTSAQISTILTNITVTISGSSIKSSPTVTVSSSNGTYILTLSNLNISSSNIPSQTITITVNKLLNPLSVTTLTSFSLSTYYTPSNADLVANAAFSGTIAIKNGSLTFINISTT